MPTYIALGTYTDHGMRHIGESPKRLDDAKALLKDMGGEFKAFYMTLGGYDLVLVYEAPDDAISARFSLMLSSFGNVRTTTLKAFAEPSYRQIVASLA